jgi:hypothetical protein
VDTLFLNNDHVVELSGLKDVDGSFIADAIVQATLYENATDTEVAGVSWPITLQYQGSAGRYLGELSRDIDVVEGGRYQLKLTAESVGKQYEATRTVKVTRRYS